jgi:tetratricopeptide (TPR) repeat protein
MVMATKNANAMGNLGGTDKHPLGYNKSQYITVPTKLQRQTSSRQKTQSFMKRATNHFFAVFILMLWISGSMLHDARADEIGTVNQLLQAGQWSEASIQVENYLGNKPGDPQLRFLKGVIQHRTDQKNAAIATFSELTRDYPELPEPYNNLGVLYAGQGLFDKARAALEMAVRTKPDYATAHENLGDVYAKLAAEAYRQALQFDNANSTAQAKLKRLGEEIKPSSNH